MKPNFTVHIFWAGAWDAQLDVVDVEVGVDGRRYAASFTTLAGVGRLMDRYRETGECASGAYFWMTDVIVVREVTEDAIDGTIEHLLHTGELTSALTELLDESACDV